MAYDPDSRARFVEVFLREWEMSRDAIRRRRTRLRGVGSKEIGSSRPFDADVRTGEIRVFADFPSPVLGLVTDDLGDDGWLVVPISEFSVPATDREILLGDRVYRLWDGFTAPRRTVERGWIVERVSFLDRDAVMRALRVVRSGDEMSDDLAECTAYPVLSTDDPRLEYESCVGVASRGIDGASTGFAGRGSRSRLSVGAVAILVALGVLSGVVTAFWGLGARSKPSAPSSCIPATGTGEAPVRIVADGAVAPDAHEGDSEGLIDAIEAAMSDERFGDVLAHTAEAVESPDPEVRRTMVEALSWFGVEAMAELIPYLDDSDESVRADAAFAWSSAVGQIEDEVERIEQIEMAMMMVLSPDSLETIGDDYLGVDEDLAVRSLLRVIEVGGPEAVRRAKEMIEVITGEPFVDA